MSTELADALDIARAVAAEAAALLTGAAGKVGQVRSKSNPRDLVTEWDTRTEELIREQLGRHTPRIPILAEEAGASGGPVEELEWVVDPIDGTVNFAHGLPMFAVSIGLEQRGQPVVGVVAAPALGWTFWGRRGGGAFHDENPMRVSTTARLEQALLATGFPYDRATNPDNNLREWDHFQRHAGACRRFGAASLDLCMVARGWFDGYWEKQLKPWDLAAGVLLVIEAGGCVTGWKGQSFCTRDGAAVASNGAIHSQLTDELAEIGRARESGTRHPHE